jgi:hypothetical protein
MASNSRSKSTLKSPIFVTAMSMTPLCNQLCRLSSRIRSHIRKGFNLCIRGTGKVVWWWKKQRSKISCQGPFNKRRLVIDIVDSLESTSASSSDHYKPLSYDEEFRPLFLHCKSVPAQSQLWHTMWQICFKWRTISHMWSISNTTCFKCDVVPVPDLQCAFPSSTLFWYILYFHVIFCFYTYTALKVIIKIKKSRPGRPFPTLGGAKTLFIKIAQFSVEYTHCKSV